VPAEDAFERLPPMASTILALTAGSLTAMNSHGWLWNADGVQRATSIIFPTVSFGMGSDRKCRTLLLYRARERSTSFRSPAAIAVSRPPRVSLTGPLISPLRGRQRRSLLDRCGHEVQMKLLTQEVFMASVRAGDVRANSELGTIESSPSCCAAHVGDTPGNGGAR
jgi:hypothetical protein